MLRKAKKTYYKNVDERKGSDNKLFWKTVKLSLSEKFNVRERISLIEIVKAEKEQLRLLTIFLKNLNIFQYSDFDLIIENVKDPNLKAILKHKKHSSFLAIGTKCNRIGVFSFKEVSFKQIET